MYMKLMRFCLCLLLIFVFYCLTIETKVEKMAANTKVCTFEWPGLYYTMCTQSDYIGHTKPIWPEPSFPGNKSR